MKPSPQKIYISGKITGLDPEVAEARFLNKAMEIAEQGHISVNPFAIGKLCKGYMPPGFSPTQEWQFYMRECVMSLAQCDAIHLFPDWQNSKGAQVERNLAKTLGLEIVYL